MKKYQVWWHGCELRDITANSKEEALSLIKNWYRVKRAPAGTVVIEIPTGYYKFLVENNKRIGINCSNM